MLPMIGILLCVYLVFKGFEIFQIALCSPDPPMSSYVIGVIAIIASIVIAIFVAVPLWSAGTTSTPLR